MCALFMTYIEYMEKKLYNRLTWVSNQGTLGPETFALTIRPRRYRCIYVFIYLYGNYASRAEEKIEYFFHCYSFLSGVEMSSSTKSFEYICLLIILP